MLPDVKHCKRPWWSNGKATGRVMQMSAVQDPVACAHLEIYFRAFTYGAIGSSVSSLVLNPSSLIQFLMIFTRAFEFNPLIVDLLPYLNVKFSKYGKNLLAWFWNIFRFGSSISSVALWARPLSQTSEPDFWARPLSHTSEPDLWARPLNQTSEPDLWTSPLSQTSESQFCNRISIL